VDLKRGVEKSEESKKIKRKGTFLRPTRWRHLLGWPTTALELFELAEKKVAIGAEF